MPELIFELQDEGIDVDYAVDDTDLKIVKVAMEPCERTTILSKYTNVLVFLSCLVSSSRKIDFVVLAKVNKSMTYF